MVPIAPSRIRMRRDSRSRSSASVEFMAPRFMWLPFFSLENAKNPACEMRKGPGFMAALAGFVMGLAPRRPQAGFDLFNQIGARKLYGISCDFGRKGGCEALAGSNK